MNAALAVTDLVVAYGSQPPIIDGLTLPTLPGGTVTGLLGPNGAGKSTVLRGLAGLRPASGSAALGAVDTLQLRPSARAALVSFMPQAAPVVVGFTVLESVIVALRAGSSLDDREAAEKAASVLDRLGILPLAGRPVDRLSGGQRQLASLAQALVREPRILLLDEPTSALDVSFQFEVMELVRREAAERGSVVIAVLHDINLASRWCDRLAILKAGRLAAVGRPEDVITPELIRSVWGVEASVGRSQGGWQSVAIEGRAGDTEGQPRFRL